MRTPKPDLWRRLARVAVLVATYAGSLLASRWAMGLGSPREDLRPLYDAAHDARYYWRRRELYARRALDAIARPVARLVAWDELTGATQRRLYALRERVRLGEFSDDTRA